MIDNMAQYMHSLPTMPTCCHLPLEAELSNSPDGNAASQKPMVATVRGQRSMLFYYDAKQSAS